MEGILCDSVDDCTDFMLAFKLFVAGDNLPPASLLLRLKEVGSSILNINNDPTCLVSKVCQ